METALLPRSDPGTALGMNRAVRAGALVETPVRGGDYGFGVLVSDVAGDETQLGFTDDLLHCRSGRSGRVA